MPPCQTAAHDSASRSAAVSSSSAGRVHGIRTKWSSPPSAANTGPGATMTPRRSASVTTAVAAGAGSWHHSASPPRGRWKRQSGS